MTPTSIYRFHHHLVRDTVYGGLLKRARASLHVDFVRWADQVNAERGRGLEFEEILGYHLEQAHRYLGELGPLDEKGHEIGRDASRRLASAGRRAFARGDAHAAENLFRRAIALLKEDDPLRLPLLPRARRGAARARPVRRRARRSSTKRSRWPRRPTTSASRPRPTWCACYVRMHSGEPGSWSEATLELTTETIPLLEQRGRARRAGTRLAPGRAGPADRRRARRRPAKRSRRSSRTPALAGDERLVARSALGLTFNALYGPTPVPAGARAVRGVHHRRAARPPGAGPDHVQARAAARDERRLRERARRCTARRARCCDDLGQSVRAASSSLDLAMVELLAGDAAAAEREAARRLRDAACRWARPTSSRRWPACWRARCVRRAATRKRSS